MASKKKKLTPLQKEYNKQYRAYIKRIKSAKQAGFLIPENYVKIKKEKPRRRDIESLKRVTRKSIQEEVRKGKIEYASPFTGEVITGGRAASISRKRKPIYIEPERPNYERPTTFEEAILIKDKINEYFKKHRVPESNKKAMGEAIIGHELSLMRGHPIDFDEFKRQEIENGWLFKDPNRPLEQEEIEYIQDKIDTQVSEAKILGEHIEDLRGWNPDFNYYDKYFENEKDKGQLPVELFDLKDDTAKEKEIGSKWVIGERPETIERPESNVGEIPLEMLALDNLRERIRNIELSGESYKSRVHSQSTRDKIFKSMADNNKNVLEERLDALVKKYGPSYVDAAIAKASATGRAFQEYFLYRGTIMSQYITDIEKILLGRDEYYQIAEQVESGGEMHDEPQ